MFARESLQHFTTAEKDALYSIMNREDLNWRKLNLQILNPETLVICTLKTRFSIQHSTLQMEQGTTEHICTLHPDASVTHKH
jgi:hypothetical protein